MTSAIGMNRALKGKYAQAGTLSGCVCRISVRSYVLLPGGDLDECNRPVPPKRQIRRSAAHAPSAPSEAPRHERPAQGGVSLSTAFAVVGIFVFVLGIITLMNTSRMTERSKSIFSLRTQIEAVQKANSELAVKLDAAADGAKICYAAARNLGMVSAEGAEVVYLTAPKTRSDTDTLKAAVPQARTGIYATLFGFLE